MQQNGLLGSGRGPFMLVEVGPREGFEPGQFGGRASPPTDWPRDRVPYPGLDAFVEDEAAVFFGREAQSEDLTRRLHEVQDRPADRFLVLVGASGSGKSSLVRAGVMPRLRRRRWSILPAFFPGPNPLLPARHR